MRDPKQWTLRYAIVDGMNVRDGRVHNYPPRWTAASSQELLVIRRNHKIGEVWLDPLRWGLIPLCSDPKGGRKPINAKCEAARRASISATRASNGPDRSSVTSFTAASTSGHT